MGAERRIRVVCVDDCPRVLAAWSRLLGLQPDMETIATLETSATLAELVASGRPDVVVMDLSLSDGESLPAVQSLVHKEPDTRVLMYSGHSDQQVVDRCVEAGAWGFVGKDSEPAVVLEAIRRIARGEAVFPSWTTTG